MRIALKRTAGFVLLLGGVVFLLMALCVAEGRTMQDAAIVVAKSVGSLLGLAVYVSIVVWLLNSK